MLNKLLAFVGEVVDTEILRVVGRFAGVGGIAIGFVLIVFREVIRQKIFPRLTKSHAFKINILIIVGVFIIALCGIGAWVYTETYTPKKDEKIQMSSVQVYLKKYGFSTVSIVDLNIKNKGTFPENIAKIKFNIKRVFEYDYDPCPTCLRSVVNGVYTFSFKRVVEGADEYPIPHVVEPGTIERINLVLGGNLSDRKSYLARITITIFTGSGKTMETNPIDVLVQNFDNGNLLPIDKLGESKLKEFVDFGTNPPELLTPTIIKQYFSGQGSVGRFGARLPSLPNWYEEKFGVRSLLLLLMRKIGAMP